MTSPIDQLDISLFRWLNNMDNPVLNFLMYWASDLFIWIPFYIFLGYLLYQIYAKKSYKIILFALVNFLLCDQIAGFCKHHFKRFRPSHSLELNHVLLSEHGAGGNYGYVSAHAANAFGLCVFMLIMLPKKYNSLKFLLFFWSVLVSVSRIYNAAHYPTDVLRGMILGVFLGVTMGFSAKK